MTRAELAAGIGTTLESVSRREREEGPMEPWVPLAVLGLVRERLMPAPTHVEVFQVESPGARRLADCHHTRRTG
jgi:hypothetical protein